MRSPFLSSTLSAVGQIAPDWNKNRSAIPRDKYLQCGSMFNKLKVVKIDSKEVTCYIQNCDKGGLWALALSSKALFVWSQCAHIKLVRHYARYLPCRPSNQMPKAISSDAPTDIKKTLPFSPQLPKTAKSSDTGI